MFTCIWPQLAMVKLAQEVILVRFVVLLRECSSLGGPVALR